MKFKELKFDDISETHGEGAIQAYVDLGNGFDVSVVKHKFSYGGEKDLYEIGVFDNQRRGMDAMCDPLDWGDTVKGWLTPEGVETELELIGAL
jgi:hypothetical protein